MPRSRQLSILPGHPPGDKSALQAPASPGGFHARRGPGDGGAEYVWAADHAMAASPRRSSPGLLRLRGTRAMLVEALGDPHIDVIGDFGAAVAPEQDRAPYSISPTSVGFDGVSALPQPRRELQQYIVAVQPGSLING